MRAVTLPLWLCLAYRVAFSVFVDVWHLGGEDALCTSSAVGTRCEMMRSTVDVERLRAEVQREDPLGYYMVTNNTLLPTARSFSSLATTIALMLALFTHSPRLRHAAAGAWLLYGVTSLYASTHHAHARPLATYLVNTPAALDTAGGLLLLVS